MPHIDRAFVGVALFWLMFGMVFGLYIGMTQSHQFVPVHITMLLPGFVVLAVYGALYRLWPAMKDSWLAKPHFWVSAVAVFGQVFGAYQFVQSGGSEMTVIMLSSVLAILGGAMMGWLFWTKSAHSASSMPAHAAHWH